MTKAPPGAAPVRGLSTSGYSPPMLPLIDPSS